MLDEPYNFSIVKIESNLFTDVGDIFCMPVEGTLDCFAKLIQSLVGAPDIERATVTARIFDFDISSDTRHLFSHYVDNLIRREERYFSRFGDSEAFTPGVEDGTEDIDQDKLMDDQRKVLWDAMKSTYFSKYKMKVDDRVRDEAFYLSDWNGIDFVVIPPLAAAYLYYRGIEKKFEVLEFDIRASFKPIHEWFSDDNTVASFGLEIGPDDWPVNFILAAGMDDGDVELQFIGIGTSLNAVRRAIGLYKD